MSDFNCTTKPTARVEHKCEECGRTIAPGEIYERTAAVWEGEFFTSVACAHCGAARRIVNTADDCYSEGYYGGLWEWLDELGFEFEAETGIPRLAACIRARWRYQSGQLMPIPEVSARTVVAA